MRAITTTARMRRTDRPARGAAKETVRTMGDVPYNVVVTSRPMKRVFTGAPWEKKIGYCRAVRAGSHVFVSGTAPVAHNGSAFAPRDPYGPAQRFFQIACWALRAL